VRPLHACNQPLPQLTFIFTFHPPVRSACPSGAPTVDLSQNWPQQQPDINIDQDAWTTSPAVFSVPLVLPDNPITAATHGSWQRNNHVWQLCIQGPPHAISLTLIFDHLTLPVHSKLEAKSLNQYVQINAPGVTNTRRALTAFDNGVLASTLPIPGSAVLLTYSFPGADAIAKAMAPNIRISAVLMGTQPLPWLGADGDFPPNSKPAEPHSKPSQHEHSEATVKDLESLTSKEHEQDSMMRAPVVEDAQSMGELGLNVAASPLPELSLSEIIAARVTLLSGAALECLEDAGCFSEFENATRATVLLMLSSVRGGRFCTGTLLNGPDPAEQLIVTANHCRGTDDDFTIAMLW
jgi:hypothetical protein